MVLRALQQGFQFGTGQVFKGEKVSQGPVGVALCKGDQLVQWVPIPDAPA